MKLMSLLLAFALLLSGCAAFGEGEPGGTLPVNIPALDENYRPAEDILWPTASLPAGRNRQRDWIDYPKTGMACPVFFSALSSSRLSLSTGTPLIKTFSMPKGFS